jgi:hypothetical protein
MNEGERERERERLYEDWKSFFMRKYFHCVYMSVAIKPSLLSLPPLLLLPNQLPPLFAAHEGRSNRLCNLCI